ncbi:MAG: twin-arginine translocase TatA/TatE family subunit [Acidobacteria bacterium]|nr:twin-arginine translocase TatA/TatE family subunit [Acidobacteriota bacterium]MDW7983479.1 twin-arginine translocase TatA/TatE family subunit [Acidobacteriota bacterium]
MFGNLGFGEMVLIALVILLLFGPDKLPELLRQVGRTMAEIRQAAERAQAVVREEWARASLEKDLGLADPSSETSEAAKAPRPGPAEVAPMPREGGTGLETAHEWGPEVTGDDPEGRR